MADDQSTAIGRLEGEVKHIAQDLARGRDRIHELSQTTQRVETRLQTLVETATPQRERMIADLAEIKETLATMSGLPKKVDDHGRLIDDHERFKNKSLGVISVVSIIGGALGTAGAAAVRWMFGGHS